MLWTLCLDNMYMVGFYSHEAMKDCYITVGGILCIQLVIGFIACRMLSHFMYFVRNDEIKMFNQSINTHTRARGRRHILYLSNTNMTVLLHLENKSVQDIFARPVLGRNNLLRWEHHSKFFFINWQVVQHSNNCQTKIGSIYRLG